MSKYIIQFNEANFDLIKKYCLEHSLPNLEKIINLPTKIGTTSEGKYESLEPWIQWYSFYSSKTLEEHRVFHLGDCLTKDHQTIFDRFAGEGLKVGIFSSMNHKPNVNFSVYIPDPWTETNSDSSFSSKFVSIALNFVVNNNSSMKINLKSLVGIFLIIIPSFFRMPNLVIECLLAFIKKDRVKLASIFDALFLEYSINRSKNKNLDVAAIFLNGLAHLQHHYLKESKFINSELGKNGNVTKDPILIALKIYDRSFRSLSKLIESGEIVWVITGLTQEAYPEPINYWRFKDHKKILSKLINSKFSCYPRMTRDFELVFKHESDAKEAKELLERCLILEEDKTYEAFGFIDLRSNKLFASLTYSGQKKDVKLIVDTKTINLNRELEFIALKNGGHVHFGWAFSNHVLKKSYKGDEIAIWDLTSNI